MDDDGLFSDKEIEELERGQRVIQRSNEKQEPAGQPIVVDFEKVRAFTLSLWTADDPKKPLSRVRVWNMVSFRQRLTGEYRAFVNMVW